MKIDNIGFIIIAISILGYISNWLNWRFLNYKINHFLYYLGAFVHESSHAMLCLLTGAKITEYKVFNNQPRVSYYDSKIPVFGNLFIAIAPIIGGLTFIFLLDKFLLNIYHMPTFTNWHLFFQDFLKLLKQINFIEYQSYIIAFIFLNMGAMLGPSIRDLKNVWFLIGLLIFVKNPFVTHLGLLSLAFILVGILIQIVLIILVYIIKKLNPF